jgi:hypothetical protein
LKAIVNKKWYGVPVLVFAVVAVLAVGAIVWAATSVTFHGGGTVGPTTGGGTPPPGALTYDFVVGANPSAGTVATDATFTFDPATTTMLRGGVYTKTVYLKKTGTAASFNVAVTAANVSAGITVGGLGNVSLGITEETIPVAVPITFTVDAAAPFAPVTWDINFALVP